MFRLAALLLPLLCAAPAAAQRDTAASAVAIERVEIAGRRPLREIGVQRTELDSSVLRQSIAASLADALAAGSGLFIKSYGRATLSTVSFRGTAPSHTQVTWNGLKMNSPMLGQVDFSLIPAYLVDEAAVYAGASSVGIAGGGLGGAIALETRAPAEEGLALRYIQGIGSFTTFDEFLHLSYRGRRWSTSTRVLVGTSENDFRYRNYDSKQFVTDADGRIVGSSYPLQRNRNGAFRDLHALQELRYTTQGGDRLSLSVWYTDTNRGLALLSSDRNTTREKRNTQDQHTLRAVAGWERLHGGLKLGAQAGYVYDVLRYRMESNPDGQGGFVPVTDARSRIGTGFARAEAEYALGRTWLFTADVTLHQHRVRSGDRSVIDAATGRRADTLYLQQRFELAAFAAVKWRPIPRLGVAADLRWELCGNRSAPPIPALLADYLVSKRGAVLLKASVARNYRFPTLNDLYFQPGGNPRLRPEHGWTWDAGAEATLQAPRRSLKLSATVFDARIDDWILWIATTRQGVYTPINIRRVHSCGAEGRLTASLETPRGWRLAFDGHLARTRSIHRGDPLTPGDRSVGKQLVYIPEWSASCTARMAWRHWELVYRWVWYSERYTMSDNDLGVLGRVGPYFMSDLSLEKSVELRWASLAVKGCIYNLLNEEYQSVLGRPMPRLHGSIYISIAPKFRKR